MLQEHGIAAIIYGGTFADEDFRDRKVADEWFEEKYNMKLKTKDHEATTKYNYDLKLQTGGTFGVNYTTLKGSMLSFNYKSIYMSEEQRVRIHEEFILGHYLKQFNEETIADKKNHKNCGEPCATVCKKMYGKYKKDYEPYQTMGPLSGIFDQRAAESLNHHADMLGFDAISVGGTLSWMMECLSDGLVSPEEFGATKIPDFDPDHFDVVHSSMHNASIGVELLEAIIHKKGIVDLSNGTRVFAKKLAKERGREILDKFVYTAYAAKGWMVPNQYWTPGVLSPMSIMGKYYMYYGSDFMVPEEVGAKGAQRLAGELVLDNIGMCRFHRGWAEEMMPEIMGSVFDLRNEYIDNIDKISSEIRNKNSSVYWESERNIDFVQKFLERKINVEQNNNLDLIEWVEEYQNDKNGASLRFWYDMLRGVQEGLKV
jgi:glyceraldehyde-3-phosphate dehydrogenase (ferredoxin)